MKECGEENCVVSQLHLRGTIELRGGGGGVEDEFVGMVSFDVVYLPPYTHTFISYRTLGSISTGTYCAFFCERKS